MSLFNHANQHQHPIDKSFYSAVAAAIFQIGAPNRPNCRSGRYIGTYIYIYSFCSRKSFAGKTLSEKPVPYFQFGQRCLCDIWGSSLNASMQIIGKNDVGNRKSIMAL